MIAWLSPISNITTIDKIDTEVNNSENSKSFATHRKPNNSDPELYDTNTTTTKVTPEVNSYQ